jgi:hypothetical protein
MSDYDRRQGSEGLSPAQTAYLKRRGEQLADLGFTSLECGVADTGKKNVVRGLMRRGLIELNREKSGFNSGANAQTVFYRATPAGEALIEQMFGLRRR